PSGSSASQARLNDAVERNRNRRWRARRSVASGKRTIRGAQPSAPRPIWLAGSRPSARAARPPGAVRRRPPPNSLPVASAETVLRECPCFASTVPAIATLCLAAVGVAMNGWFAQSAHCQHIAGSLLLTVGIAADLVALVMPSCRQHTRPRKRDESRSRVATNGDN